MKKLILAMAAAAVAVLFIVELGAEQMFRTRFPETVETAASAYPQELHSEAPAVVPGMPEVYALFGVDAEEGESGRSDCIILVSLEGDVLRMCSLARDTMVSLPDSGEETKLGHAYAYGGADYALETIRESFGLDVTRYASVNFSQLPRIVDLLGGAEVGLSREEWRALELPDPYLGKRRLSGEEALRYCRLRSIDSDDARTGRQRKLVEAMAAGLKNCPPSRLPELTLRGIRMCRTNLRPGEILRLGRQVLSCPEGLRVESMALPGSGVSAWGGIRSDGAWYYVYDLHRAGELLQTFFLGEDACTVMEPDKKP